MEFLPIPRSLPEFNGELENRTALVLFWGQLLVIGLTVFFGAIFIALDPRPSVLALVNLGLVLEVTSFILLLRGQLIFSKSMFIFSVWTTLVYASWASGGVDSPTIGALGMVIVLGAIFFGWQGAVVAGLFSVLSGGGLLVLEWLEMLPSAGSHLPAHVIFISSSTHLLATTTLLVFYNRILFGEKTKAQRAEVALGVERDRLGLAVQAARMGFWELNQASQELSVDERWAGRLGYERESHVLPREKWVDYIHPEDQPSVLKVLDESFREATNFDVEFRHRMADDTWRWVMSRGRLEEGIEQDGGKRILGVHTDIHERKLVEEALAASRQELESVLLHTPIVVWRVDQEGVFTLAEGFGLQAFNLSSEWLIGRHISELEEISQTWVDTIAGSLSGHENERVIEIGSASFNARSAPIFDVGGKLIGAIGVAADISEQIKIENKLHEANRDLEAANQAIQDTQKKTVQQERLAAVGQLASGIAHDFNNALLPITLYVEMLLGETDLSPLMRERLDTVLSQARRAASLTEQILDFGRKSLMQTRCMSLYSFLEHFLNMLLRTLPENIRIELEASGGEYLIWGDENRLEQVMMNLAINARDAMPAGGKLSFRLERVTLAEESSTDRIIPAGEWVRLDVVDTGEGIPPEIMAQIFEPFFTTKPGGSGSGLGLAQVYGIIKQHEGYVFAHSPNGRGACFSLWFPRINRKGCEEEGNDTTGLMQGSGERIVVVEDNPVTRAALVDVLELLEYDVIKAKNPEEAIRIYSREHVDLVLSDMVMPEMSGVELFKCLKEIDPKVRMVIVTGYPLGEEKRELTELGISGWVQKPLDMHRIQQVVQNALQGVVSPI